MKYVGTVLLSVFLVAACQAEVEEQVSTVSETSVIVETTTTEQTTEQVVKRQVIYTSTEIQTWKQPEDQIQQALMLILNDLKSTEDYVDAGEYLFEIQSDGQILVQQNFRDQLVELATYSYQVDFDTVYINVESRN